VFLKIRRSLFPAALGIFLLVTALGDGWAQTNPGNVVVGAEGVDDGVELLPM
jgi:hypothetical protein